MCTATDAAWDGNWREAIEAYERALDHFPEDVDALAGLGMACSSVGRMEEALDAYRRASDLEPDDPVLLERIGEVLEELGRAEEATEAYLASGKCYIEQQQAPRLALGCWQAAARLCPRCVEAHVELLKHYQHEGETGKAVDECLDLARIYRDQGRLTAAIRICRYALRMSPGNSRALAALNELQGEAPREEEGGLESESEREMLRQMDLSKGAPLEFEVAGRDGGEVENGNPAELTRRRALRDLAERIFDENREATSQDEGVSKEAMDALLSKAMDLQTRGRAEEAIKLYERVIQADGDCPAVRFNLGMLYRETLRFAEALAHFERAVAEPDYRLGSHFAMAECYRASGRTDEALTQFIEVLRILDLGTAEAGHVDELNSLYERNGSGGLIGDGQARGFVTSLAAFFNEAGWEAKVRQGRQRLDGLSEQGPVISLVEAMGVRDWERILKSLATSQEYARHGLVYTAAEECHFALESAPNYLPTHRQLAEVSRQMGRVKEAVRAFVVIAKTYEVRGTWIQAAGIYERALRLGPMDTAVRASLIQMLVRHGAIERALRHYLILADSYYHLAQLGQARETYEEALQLAQRTEDTQEWKVQILHKIGDIDVQRVDWRSGVSVYERIRDLAPKDERARLALLELYYRLDEPQKARRELEEVLNVRREEVQLEHFLRVLDEMVDRWPEKIDLRAGVAQARLDAGHTEEALRHLDKLGDLQLDAGQMDEAASTIRAIIALDPPDVDDYRVLLERIDTGPTGAH